jgi:hypothetical protein
MRRLRGATASTGLPTFSLSGLLTGAGFVEPRFIIRPNALGTAAAACLDDDALPPSGTCANCEIRREKSVLWISPRRGESSSSSSEESRIGSGAGRFAILIGGDLKWCSVGGLKAVPAGAILLPRLTSFDRPRGAGEDFL